MSASDTLLFWLFQCPPDHSLDLLPNLPTEAGGAAPHSFVARNASRVSLQSWLRGWSGPQAAVTMAAAVR
jgi:hypothetical protein